MSGEHNVYPEKNEKKELRTRNSYDILTKTGFESKQKNSDKREI